ncbi:baseplate hub subunit and tail lysozyme [Xanthomonas phage XaC1]|nr:baseplate hub subunit and tail lysozyme [Xanthomonas phage XaC1]
MSWMITNTDAKLLENIKNFEGTIQAQTRLGYFKNNKFWQYKDHLGYPTIGYGHLITINESFRDGLSTAQADSLLSKDITQKVLDAKFIYDQYKMDLPQDAQRVLVEMVFQMGKAGVMQFKNTLTLLANKNYKAAANGMRNSLWYRQTTNRAEILAKRIEACA